jgi:hypothetical protein
MNLAPVVAQLKADLTSFRQVGAVADMATAEAAKAIIFPAAFVVPMDERAGAVASISGAPQQIDVRFMVVVVIANRRDATGAAALNDLQARRDEVLTALRGWVPDGAINAPVWQAGRVLRLAEPQLWWGDTFACIAYT